MAPFLSQSSSHIKATAPQAITQEQYDALYSPNVEILISKWEQIDDLHSISDEIIRFQRQNAIDDVNDVKIYRTQAADMRKIANRSVRSLHRLQRGMSDQDRGTITHFLDQIFEAEATIEAEMVRRGSSGYRIRALISRSKVKDLAAEIHTTLTDIVGNLNTLTNVLTSNKFDSNNPGIASASCTKVDLDPIRVRNLARSANSSAESSPTVVTEWATKRPTESLFKRPAGTSDTNSHGCHKKYALIA